MRKQVQEVQVQHVHPLRRWQVRLLETGLQQVHHHQQVQPVLKMLRKKLQRLEEQLQRGEQRVRS